VIVDRSRVAAMLPRIDLGAPVGSGAQGQVIFGHHRDLRRDVAIKVLPFPVADAKERFAREARLLAGMDHPHVVRVYDYAADRDYCVIVMEMLAGGTLHGRMGHITEEDACAVGLAVAAALTHAHTKGVLHRDIKPANILFDGKDLLKVGDFGIAKVMDDAVATASAAVGTPQYMAPEQFLAAQLQSGTDIYALGGVLYELLTGAPAVGLKLPARELRRRHLEVAPAPPAGVPAPVARVILRALAKDPAIRQPSAQAFAYDLALAAREAYGPRWLDRANVEVRLDDDIREVANRPISGQRSGPFPRQRATASRSSGTARNPSTQHSIPDDQSPMLQRPSATSRIDSAGILGGLAIEILTAMVTALGFAIGAIAAVITAAAANTAGRLGVVCVVSALGLGLGLGAGVGAGVGVLVALPLGLFGFVLVAVSLSRP
jgi:serine/threonine-protein kinase